MRALPLLALVACSDVSEPRIVAIEPDHGDRSFETPVSIRVEGLGASVLFDYRDRESSRIESEVTARLEAIDLASVRLEPGNTIAGVVPAQLVPGTYDLVVADASDRTAMREDAFTVDEPEPDPEPGPTPIPNLIGHWKFDEDNPSTIALDSSGHDLRGTLREFSDPVVEFMAGRLGNALAFDGNVSWVAVPHAPIMDEPAALDAITIAAWVFKTADGPAAQIIAGQQRGTGIQDHFSLFFQADQYLQFGLETVYAGHWDVPWPHPNEWAHIAATWSRASGTSTLYVDGAAVVSTVVSVDLSPAAEPWIIGGGMNTPNDDAEEIFPGSIDDLRIYSRVLTSTEVAVLAAQ